MRKIPGKMTKKILWLDETITDRRNLQSDIEKAQVDDSFTELFSRNILIDCVICVAIVGMLTGVEGGNSERCRRRRWNRVVLSHVRGKIDFNVQAIKTSDNVDRLSLSGSFQSCISDLLGEGLARTNSLKELSLFPSVLTRRGASTLAKGFSSNSSLEEIALSGSQLDYEFMRGIIDSLRHSPKIRSVRMDGCGLDDHQITELSGSLCFYRNLRELSLDRNFCLSMGVHRIARILSMGRLEKLNLSSKFLQMGIFVLTSPL